MNRLRHFGNVTVGNTAIESLPSSSAVNSVLNGEPGGWFKVAGTTSLRAGLILPGLAIAGVRGRQLIVGSLLGAVGITAFLFVYYMYKRQNQPQPAPAPTQPSN